MIGLREDASEAADSHVRPGARARRWKRLRGAIRDAVRARAEGAGRAGRAGAAARSSPRALDPGLRVEGVPRAPDRELHAAPSTSTTTRASAPRSSDVAGSTRIGSRRRSTPRTSCRIRPPARRGTVGGRHAAEAQEKTSSSDGSVRSRRHRSSSSTADDVVLCGRLAAAARLRHAARELRARSERSAPRVARAAARALPRGLTTAEVALLLAEGSDPLPDRERTSSMLESLVAEDRAVRLPVGSDAVWIRSL